MAGCDGEWTELGGVGGYRFTSRTNGNTLFLPAAGSCWDDTIGSFGSRSDGRTVRAVKPAR